MKKLYVCASKDIDNPDDIHIVWANGEEECRDILADRTCDEIAREHVLDRAINMSLAEHFFHWNGRFIWNMHPDREGKVIPEIERKFNGDYKKINQWINDVFKENVYSFFKDNQELAQSYLEYYFDENINEPNHLDQIAWYMVRHDPDWITWCIREIDVKQEAL